MIPQCTMFCKTYFWVLWLLSFAPSTGLRLQFGENYVHNKLLLHTYLITLYHNCDRDCTKASPIYHRLKDAKILLTIPRDIELFCVIWHTCMCVEKSVIIHMYIHKYVLLFCQVCVTEWNLSNYRNSEDNLRCCSECFQVSKVTILLLTLLNYC